MIIIIFLIALSLLTALGFLIAYFWSVKNGQFEDETTPAMRVLFEDDKAIDQL